MALWIGVPGDSNPVRYAPIDRPIDRPIDDQPSPRPTVALGPAAWT